MFLALPTPPGEDGSADLSYVLDVAEDLGKIMRDYKVVVGKSTVPVGTAEKIRAKITQYASVEFDVVSNPEFLREGFAVEDFLRPDRIVVGASSKRAFDIIRRLYKPYVRSGNPIIEMDQRSAEFTKYAANSFLATKITFMNEMANFCEKVGADVDKVRVGIGTDDRIGKRFLFPGIGYGGSCFPKDVQALARLGKQHDYTFEILNSVVSVNEKQKQTLVHRVKRYFNQKLEGLKIAIWGLAFKPDTDDIRQAPALHVIDQLLKLGANIVAFDPQAMGNVQQSYGDEIQFAENEYQALENADALVIATEWAIFRTPDFGKIRSKLKRPVIFDGRNIYDLDHMKNRGFYYESIGRNTVLGYDEK